MAEEQRENNLRMRELLVDDKNFEASVAGSDEDPLHSVLEPAESLQKVSIDKGEKTALAPLLLTHA